jgi:hypothetical protein
MGASGDCSFYKNFLPIQKNNWKKNDIYTDFNKHAAVSITVIFENIDIATIIF